MQIWLSILLGCVLVLYICVNSSSAQSELQPQPTNVLLIMYDDLRPELSIYGKDYMITPNFERLAARSVVFDQSYCQVAVCNPSRNSLLTGLRPDTTQSYNFDRAFHPHMVFPAQLVKNGYNTAASGKIAHWINGESSIWSHECWDNDWYGYQSTESRYMNSSVMPDKKPLEKFRDYEFTSKTIEHIRTLHARPQYFMAAIGFKLPHLDIHVPHSYFQMYQHKAEAWRQPKKGLKFPASCSEVSYRCCAEGRFRFMNGEGSLPHNRSHPLMDMNRALPNEMHDNLMMGYAAGITYLDSQLGRLLDVLDELKLWDNITIVLTSDHGMHNGEKGIWEKWTLFEESVKVPLLISHPQSPFQGQRYPLPVESVDIYPTLIDLLNLPKERSKNCKDWYCHPQLDGKSLAPVVLGVPVDTAGVTPVTYIHPHVTTRTSSINSESSPGEYTIDTTTTTGSSSSSSSAAAGHRPPLRQVGRSGKKGNLRGMNKAAAAASNRINNKIEDEEEESLMKRLESMDKTNGLKMTTTTTGTTATATDAGRVLAARRRRKDLLGDAAAAGIHTTSTTGSTTGAHHHRDLNAKLVMPQLSVDFAVSQAIRCAPRGRVPKRTVELYNASTTGGAGSGGVGVLNSRPGHSRHLQRQAVWTDCGDSRKDNPADLTLLGYSMRTREYRYTAYYPYNRTLQYVNLDESMPYEEELFDHKNETLGEFSRRELINLARRPSYALVVGNFRSKMAEFVRQSFKNLSPFAKN